jgi:phosphomannomutase
MERIDEYVAWLTEHGGDLSGLKFAVDCSDGSAGILAKRLFPDAVVINDVPDGTFPHHSPNPLKAEARAQIAALVREQGLDCGVIFDGDADRAMFVDERGEFIQPDYLIPVVAETFSEKGVVIHDVRTSRAAIERLKENGFTPVMGKVGHAYAKVLLRETNAICGGELAGHYYFRDFVHCDSGELAALRILSAFAAAKRRGLKVSEFMAPLLDRYANSGEVNFEVQDKAAAIDRVLAAAKNLAVETGRIDIDGYRLEYAEGWISVRQSNTEPYLRLIVECDTRERMESWLAMLSACCKSDAALSDC